MPLVGNIMSIDCIAIAAQDEFHTDCSNLEKKKWGPLMTVTLSEAQPANVESQ